MTKTIRAHETILRLLRHAGFNGYGHDARARNAASGAHTARAGERSAAPRGHEAVAAGTVDNVEILTNPDPMKRALRFYRPPQGLVRTWGIVRRKARFAWSVLFPKPDPELLALQKARAEKWKLIYEMCKDAKTIGGVAINRLKKLLYAQLVKDNPTKPPRLLTVHFDVVGLDPEGNYIDLHYDTRNNRIPDNVRIGELVNQSNTDEMMYSVGLNLRQHANKWGGVLRADRTGTNGLKTLYPVADFWKAMHPDQAPLVFPVGMADNGRTIFKDLEDGPHLLIVGATKQGKSNAINVMLCTYIWRLKPDQVRFVLFDCKNGLELGFYEHLPHLLEIEKDGIRQIVPVVEELKDVVPTMDLVIGEMDRRMKLIRQAHCKTLNEYNQNRKREEHIPDLVVVFDDYISVTLRYGQMADDKLTLLVSQARAAGIYIVLGAQYPKSDVFPSIITNNFNVVLCFKLKPAASRAMIGEADAANLAYKGRAMLSWFDELVEVQTPRIVNSVIKNVVESAITGKPSKHAAQRADVEEILTYALEHLDGALDLERIWPAFTGRLGQKRIVTMLRAADGQEFLLKDQLYRVEVNRGANGGRRLKPVNP